MRFSTIIAWLLGAGLLAALVALNHPGRVLDAVAALRAWLLVVVLFHAVPLYVDVLAWQRLFQAPPSLPRLYGIRWLSEGVNSLFPLLGELLRADLTRPVAQPGEAGATVVVDLTLGVATQVLFVALGIALFSLIAPGSTLLPGIVISVVVLCFCVASFYFLQRAGMFALSAALVRRWSAPARRLVGMEDARALDDQIRALYGRRAAILIASFWRFLGWLVSAGETWLVLYGLGRPVGMLEALMLESLSQAARTAAFAIPGGLGAQDGALLLLCEQLGLGAETGLALALAKRFREIVLAVPALGIAYVIQARRLTAAGGWRGAPPPA